MMGDKALPEWRHEPGMAFKSFYKKRFAFYPIDLSNGDHIFWEAYYSKYTTWDSDYTFSAVESNDGYGHTDLVENISEAEYIVRKLAENL
jgi:hypothetical protein